MIFAEAIPAGANDWLASFFWLAGGVLVVLKIIDHFREKPPMDEQLSDFRDEVYDKFATKAHVDGLMNTVKGTIDAHEEISTDFRKGLKQDVKDLDDKLSDRSGKIFDAIRSLGREISHLEGRLSKTVITIKEGT